MKESEQEKINLYNDIGQGKFKALSFGERVKDVMKKVKEGAANRRRKPLFESKDIKKDGE